MSSEFGISTSVSFVSDLDRFSFGLLSISSLSFNSSIEVLAVAVAAAAAHIDAAIDVCDFTV